MCAKLEFQRVRMIRVADQTKRFSGNTEAGLYFGTNRNIRHKLPQGIGQILIQFMTAVPSDVIAKQTAADTDFEFIVH